MKIWFVTIVFLGFMLGVAAETVYDFSLPETVWVVMMAFVVALIWRRNSTAVSAPFLLSTSLFLLCLGLGLVRTEIASWQFNQSPLQENVGEEITVTGVVAAEPEQRTQTQQLTVQTEDDTVLVSTDRYLPITYGDVVTVTGVLEQPTSFETDYGRTFNYPGYLRARGIEYRISFANVTITDANDGNPVIAFLLSFKQKLEEGIELTINEPMAGLSEGLLLGEKRGLGSSLEEAFRRTGIIHIVVLSGYNVMLVVTFVMFILSFFLPRRFRLPCGLLAIVAFALIVGLSATVVRASIMAALLLVAQSLHRTYSVMRALLIAGFVMVFINPYLLMYDVGFQLSFMATLGLILALPYIESGDEGQSFLSVRGYVGATIATQIAVLPLLLYHIGQVSLVSVIVNVLVLPAVPLAMLFSFLSGMTALFSTAFALPFSFLATALLQYIITMATWWSQIPFAAITIPAIPVLALISLYGALALGYVWLRYRFDQQNTRPEPLADWTIEIEADTKGGVDQRSTPPEVPKLFR